MVIYILTEFQNQTRYPVFVRSFATKDQDIKTMDPKRVLSYDDVLKVIHQPRKVLIDVRNPDEVDTTGMIPSSINIPCNIIDLHIFFLDHKSFSRVF